MFDTTAIATPTRVPRLVSALLVAALAFVPAVRLTVPTGSQAVPSAVASVNHPRATIRTRSHALNPRYFTRTLCARDASGR